MIDNDERDLKTILNTIFEKVNNIVDSLQQISHIQANQNERDEKTMKEFQTIIKKTQEDVSYTVYNNKTQLTREETLRHRNRMIGVWRKHLSKRKQQFWHGINCENAAVICETWNSDDKKILPKKFLLKFIPNESVEARNIQRVSTFERFQAEINLLKIRMRNHNTKAKQIDEEMNAFLQSKFKDEHLNNLKDL